MPDVKAVVEAGKATAAAPLGPALGPLGVNIGAIVAEINEKTASYKGMKIPVVISIDSKTKKFEVKVGSPSASALILAESKAEKGAANPKTEVKGNLSMEQVKKIAEMKIVNLNSTALKKAAREIIGTCNAMGITVEGKPAKEVQKEFAAGKYDSVFA
ncbi:MAG: 50S ribosomal protein L11 [Candidatus Diapherotrites archaeon]